MRAAKSWLIIGSLIAIVTSSCSSDDSDVERALGAAPAQVTTATLSLGPRVYQVPGAAGAQIQPDRVILAATTALIPGASGTASKLAADLAVGDFVINDYGAPGFLRAVTALSTTAGATTVMTRRAGLDEVIQTGGVAEVVPNLASGGAASLRARPAATIPLPPFDIPIAFPTVTLGNVTVAVKSGSHLAFDPSLDLGLELGFFSVSEFHAILRGALTGRLELDIHAALAQGQLSFERQVFQAPDVDVPLPPTPLVLAARLRVMVGCSVQADASVDVDTGFTLSGTLTAGAHFRDGAWGPDGSLPSFDAIHPMFGAGASLHASCELRPRLELLVEGLVGPFVDIVPSVYADVAFHAPPAEVSWGVGWTLTGGLGGTLDILFHQFTLGPVTIFDIGPQPLAGETTLLTTGYCNASTDCASGQSCSTHHCVTVPPPPPPADNCAHALNGVYCGFSTADGFSGHGDSHTIYNCSAHHTTSTSHCTTNCQVAPSGQADTCARAIDNCRGALDGGYCGYSTMDGFSGTGDARKIYFCSQHATTHTTACPNTCLIALPGLPDTCSTCGGTQCGTRCCGAGDWCGAGNKCCSGCAPGCPC